MLSKASFLLAVEGVIGRQITDVEDDFLVRTSLARSPEKSVGRPPSTGRTTKSHTFIRCVLSALLDAPAFSSIAESF